MSKHISVTFRIGDEEYDTIELGEFRQDHMYKEDVHLYESHYIKRGNRILPVSIDIHLRKKIAKDLDLAAEEGLLG